jgi:hypothetical protein
VKLKTRLFLLIAIATLWIMAFGMLTSYAWFTDSVTSTGAVITTGTLDIEVTGGPLAAEYLAPGGDYVDMGSFCASNAGNVDLKYRGIFEASEHSANGMIAYMAMKVEQNIAGEWVLLKEIDGDPESLTQYFIIPGQDPSIQNSYMLEGSLTPAQQTCYRFWVKLSGTTPNEFQGSYVDYIFHVHATQTNNTGWE